MASPPRDGARTWARRSPFWYFPFLPMRPALLLAATLLAAPAAFAQMSPVGTYSAYVRVWGSRTFQGTLTIA